MATGIDKRSSAACVFILACLMAPVRGFAQSSSEVPTGGTSTDLFVMFGSDVIRPGVALKANYNVGLGHTFGFLKRDPIGDEITFSYTYGMETRTAFSTRTMDRTPKLSA